MITISGLFDFCSQRPFNIISVSFSTSFFVLMFFSRKMSRSLLSLPVISIKVFLSTHSVSFNYGEKYITARKPASLSKYQKDIVLMTPMGYRLDMFMYLMSVSIPHSRLTFIDLYSIFILCYAERQIAV